MSMKSHYLFRKNLTNMKLIGMQMHKVGIMAICLVSPNPTKRFKKRVCKL